MKLHFCDSQSRDDAREGERPKSFREFIKITFLIEFPPLNDDRLRFTSPHSTLSYLYSINLV